MSLGYKETQDPSIYVKFPAHGEDNTYYLAWTTTPWTIISNLALTINKNLTYAKVLFEDQNYIVAKETVNRVFGEEATIIKEITGEDLLGRTYDPIFDYAKAEINADEAWKVISAEYVTTDDGTGVVHTAPAFGADDFESCKKHNIPVYNPIDKGEIH